MQPGPTSPGRAPSPAPAPPPEPEVAAPEAHADDAEVKEEPVAAAAAEEGEEEKERRGAGRGRKRRRRGGPGPSSSSPSPAAAPAPAPAGPRGGLVMVKRDLLARCMTCPLCRRLLRDATTISECLHTFCRKCIYQNFNDEEVECCPVCKIDLGCTPTEKLRADHSLQDVRSKLFPFKRKKIKAEEVPSPISLPTKRKERSISSLVVNTPKVKPTGLTGRRTRAVARKAAAAAALRGLGPIVDPVKKEIDSCDSHSQSSSLPANSSKAPQTRRQILSNAEASNHSSNKDTEGDSKELADKAELWQPLNCLVEAANRTKSFRSSSQNPIVKGEQLNGSPSSTYASKTKARENLQRSKIEDDKKDVPMPTILPKRRGQGTARRRRELQAPAAAKPDAAAAQNEKKFSSIWFSLVASFDQQGDPPLPQIPSHYLRIKDGNVPASSIQKYLMQKLSLPSESEVEIKCCEQPVNPMQPLRNLVELWLKGKATQATQTMTGSSAKEFVMVLTYGRPKAPGL
ncbi:hypothetical protein SEVIR_9G161500v4 [Setaria viridis]|uniref:RING-type domain-containing protein n=1 Tax=Setaria viridis TaxID=4556 RepID=A0A4U6SUP1_SETVI|nr:E3 ubiquitin protein ligase DRIP2-like [Setaria viridis]TKV92410.1 hypothetical protein SEVIR_9G161500v2 [Setaria viridis]